MTEERHGESKRQFPAPSVWPIVIAVAAALVVVGLMVHWALLVAGFVLAALSLGGWLTEDMRQYGGAGAVRTGPFVRLAAASDIPENQIRWFKVQGQEVLVANVDGDYFAIGNRCPHMFARLGKGKLAGTLVECPWHGARYDVADGGLACWVQRPWWLKLAYDLTLPGVMKRGVPAYDTRVENGDVFVQLT
jgi:nitrite reductase/ring-hydroxylating ferredoxin subunit